MIVTKRVSSIAELSEFLNGTVIASGTSGSNSSKSKTFTDTSKDFGSSGLGVEAGDVLHVFGEGAFVVASTPSPGATALTVATFIVNATSTQGYRILRKGREAQIVEIHSTADGGFSILHNPFAASRDKGFMCNVSTQAVTTAYAAGNAVEMFWTGTQDSGASEPQSRVRVSHIEMVFTSAGSATGVEFALTWDEDGDLIALGPTTSALTPFTGLTTSTTRSLSASFGEQVIDFDNSSAAAGKKLYLHIKLTGGGGTLSTARLYWFV